MEHLDVLPKAIASMDFALARGDFLDAFADLETSIAKALSMSGSPASSKEPFGHRLKAFREIEKPTVIAKCRVGQRNTLVDAIARLLPIRADIVHSRMHVSDLGGLLVALFVNSHLAHDTDSPARILTLVRLRELTAKLVDLAAKLETLRKPISPASSPQRPSPDAAGDP